jgi:uncharacterized membrane protein YhaH (DUF805 family)
MQTQLTYFTPQGRIARTRYWLIAVVAMALVIAVSPLAIAMLGRFAALVVFVPLYWLLFCLMAKRCHDIGRSAWWLLLLPVPLIGLLWVFAVLGFRRGQPGGNQHGPDPHRAPPDYLIVGAVS